MIYELLAVNGQMTIDELIAKTGLPNRKVRKQIAAERKAGKLIFNLQTGCGYFVQCTPQIALTQYQQIQSRIAALS